MKSPGAVLRLALKLGLFGVALYYGFWGGEYSAFDIRSLHQRLDTARGQLTATREQVDSLRVTAQALENDPATIERVARERFGMIRDGERLYRFVPVPAARPGASADDRVTSRGP